MLSAHGCQIRNNTSCSLNRIGKKTADSKLVKNVGIPSKLKTFHEDNLDDSATVTRTYALLLYGKKGKYVDTLDELRYIMAATTDKSASMLPPMEDSVKQHVLCAKYQTQIWCESHIPNQAVIKPVGHGWSTCDDGGITPKMLTQAPAPVEVRDLTQRLFEWEEVSLPACWTRVHRCLFLYRL